MRRLVLALCLLASPVLAEDIGNNTVCFVPGPDDCAVVAAAEIGKASRTLDVQQFQLTEPHIAQAIIDAKNRGVQVRLVVDKRAPHERNGQTLAIAAAGIPVWVDYLPHIAHNKVVIIDDAVVIGGSYNETVAATRFNSENELIVRDSATAHAYSANFLKRLAKSEELSAYEESR